MRGAAKGMPKHHDASQVLFKHLAGIAATGARGVTWANVADVHKGSKIQQEQNFDDLAHPIWQSAMQLLGTGKAQVIAKAWVLHR